MTNEQSVGILAYGSLIDDPGAEIEEVRISTIQGVVTPFPVEFARKSRMRGGAPTLVPHANGWQVRAQVLLLGTVVDDAADRLYRRETDQIGSGKKYRHIDTPRPNRVVIRRLERFAGLTLVVYTQISANIENLCAQQLARLAIASVPKSQDGKDGISYLMNAKANGIETPLMADYVESIKNLTGAQDLAEALAMVKKGQDG